MTVTYTSGSSPIWYFADVNGNPLGAGYMYTYSSINPSIPKPVYTDSSGATPFPNPLRFGLNGMVPALDGIYFSVDDSNPSDGYYIEIYDANQNLVSTINNYFPGGTSGGGGGNITLYQNIKNLITNNLFTRNIGSTPVNPVPVEQFLAPGAHAAFKWPDINFVKENDVVNDNVYFSLFPFSQQLAGDVTPQYYFHYDSNNVVGDLGKYIRIPICPGVINLNNTTVTVSFWGRSSTSSTVTVNIQQFFGTGSSFSPVITLLQASQTLNSSWQKYVVVGNIPSVNGKSIGPLGDDGVYLQLNLQNAAAVNIDIAQPCLFIGNYPNVGIDFSTYDEINSEIDTPRTGDIRTSLNNFQPYGWVAANDGTIGNASSSASTRANIDTWFLYQLIYESVGETYAPLFDSAGALVSYSGNAADDFNANNQLALTKQLGRVIAGLSPVSAPVSFSNTVSGGNTLTMVDPASTASFYLGAPIVFSAGSGTLPGGITAGTTYYAIPLSISTMQVSASPQGSPIALTSGSGTSNVQLSLNQLGSFTGEMTHQQSQAEVATHNHSFTVNSTSVTDGAGHQIFRNVGGGPSNSVHVDPGNLSLVNAPWTVGISATIGNTGSSTPFNIMQPTTYMNMFLKL